MVAENDIVNKYKREARVVGGEDKEVVKKGRPRAKWTAGKDIVQVGFRVDSELWHNFKLSCTKKQISLSEQVNILLSSHLDMEPYERRSKPH